jgi:type I restriction enzyme S subunit
MSVDLKYIPLTFITTNDEILKQIKNTVLFSYLLNKNEETSLSYYLETTQYGFTASALEAGSHKLVRITDINNGKVDWNTVPFCNCSDDSKYLLRDHDILVARTGGTTGKSFIVKSPPKNAVFASYLIRLRLNKNADLDFITCFLNSYLFWSQIIEMKSGSAMPNVNAEKLKTLKLPKCDVKTQREIVLAFQSEQNKNGLNGLYQKVNSIEMLFNDSDELSSNLSHQQDLITKLRQSFLREAMQGKLVKQDPKDGHAKDLLEKIKAEKAKSGRKEKELPPIKPEEIPFEIPENWVWCRLGEIANNIEYGTSEKADLNSSNIPVLRMNNIQDGKLDYENLKYVSPTIDDLPKLYLKKNDLLFNRTNSWELVGKAGVYHGTDDTMTFASYLIRVQFQKGIFADFVNAYINSSLCRITQLEPEIIQQNGQANFNGTKLRNIICPLPPSSEQSRIIKRFDELMNICDGLQQSIQASREQNELLLQQVLKEALTG